MYRSLLYQKNHKKYSCFFLPIPEVTLQLNLFQSVLQESVLPLFLFALSLFLHDLIAISDRHFLKESFSCHFFLKFLRVLL